MLTFPPHLAAHDVPHLGVIFKRIRETRGLSQTDIAKALGVTCSTISKFESTGRSRRNRIVERYIAVLQSPVLNGVLTYAPLSTDEAMLLRQSILGTHNGNGRACTVQLSAYDFTLITSPHAPAELKTLTQRLRQATRPAFICDGLWFIHAVNGAMWNLFSIAPDAALLRHWESWHMIANQFTDPSPIRAAHVNPDNSFLSTINAFFRSTLPYLFTPQMRALLATLHQLSAANRMHFSTWWYLASSFNLFPELSHSLRTLRRDDRYLHTTLRGLEPRLVPVTANTSVPYFLGIWEPMGRETEQAFDDLTGPATPNALFFAAHYDTYQTYHVNAWAETAGEIPFTG